jgi:hypothetical protein
MLAELNLSCMYFFISTIRGRPDDYHRTDLGKIFIPIPWDMLVGSFKLNENSKGLDKTEKNGLIEVKKQPHKASKNGGRRMHQIRKEVTDAA